MKAENVFIRAWKHGSKRSEIVGEENKPAETMDASRKIKGSATNDQFARVQLWNEYGLQWDRKFDRPVDKKPVK